jgi:hypothetical protein
MRQTPRKLFDFILLGVRLGALCVSAVAFLLRSKNAVAPAV